MKTLLILSLIGLILFANLNAQEGWTQVFSDTIFDPCSVHFINPDKGFVLGSNTLLKTVDGGNSWQYQDINSIASATWSDIFFVNSDTGWITGDSIVLKGTLTARIFEQAKKPYELENNSSLAIF